MSRSHGFATLVVGRTGVERAQPYCLAGPQERFDFDRSEGEAARAEMLRESGIARQARNSRRVLFGFESNRSKSQSLPARGTDGCFRSRCAALLHFGIGGVTLQQSPFSLVGGVAPAPRRPARSSRHLIGCRPKLTPGCRHCIIRVAHNLWRLGGPKRQISSLKRILGLFPRLKENQADTAECPLGRSRCRVRRRSHDTCTDGTTTSRGDRQRKLEMWAWLHRPVQR
jgi:hypothetical protein